jgi:hypothetical protein
LDKECRHEGRIEHGYWSARPPAGVERDTAAAERLGFDSI